MQAESEKKRAEPIRQEYLPWEEAVFHILHALGDAERHAYAIMKEVAQRTGGKVIVGEPLGMVSLGLLEQTDKRVDPELDRTRRRYYRLTDLGRRLMAAEVEAAAALVKENDPQQRRERLQPALQHDAKYAAARNEGAVLGDPRHVGGSNSLAELWMSVRKYEEAESLLRRTVEEDPDAPRALLNWGITLCYLGRYADAQQPLSKLIRLRPHWLTPHVYLGIALLETGQPAEAQANLERATGSDEYFGRKLPEGSPEQALTYLYLGRLYAQQREPEKAAAAWRTYLEKDPDSPNAPRVRELLAEFGCPPDAQGV